MSITKKLALRHLKQNKTRSVLTVLGITISVVMLTVIFTCATYLHIITAKEQSTQTAIGISLLKQIMKVLKNIC